MIVNSTGVSTSGCKSNKHVLDFYAENYKLLVKETKSLNKQSYSLHSKSINFLKIDIGFQCKFYQNLQLLLFSHSVVSDSATPWTVVRQASLSFTISQSLLKLMSIESVMPSNHLSSVVPFSSCLQPFPVSGLF